MSKEDNVDKIKSYIEDILGTKSSLRKKLPSKRSKEKELFCEILNNLQFVNARTMGMKHDILLNFFSGNCFKVAKYSIAATDVCWWVKWIISFPPLWVIP